MNPARAHRSNASPIAERGQQDQAFEFHPFANAFPLIEGEEFDRFVARMKARGFRRSQPIVLFEGMILDGRNRWRGARAAGVHPYFRPFNPAVEGDPLEFVISENLDRRHLNASQRAVAAAKLETFRHGGARNGGKGIDRKTAAKLLNVSTRSVADATRLQAFGSDKLKAAVAGGEVAVSVAADVATFKAPDAQDEIVARGEKEILAEAKKIRAEKTERRRAARVVKLAKIAKGNGPLPTDVRYPVILADPAWRYEFPAFGDSDRSVENHYDTMPLAEICKLPVRELATPIAFLGLWVPAPLIFYVVKPVLDAWGFDYPPKSELIWDKVNPITGKWARGRHEHLFLCTRGAMPLPPTSAVPESLFSSPRTATHSEKPHGIICPMIEKMYPELPRIELFARQARLGWASWGNQAPQTIKVETAKRKAAA